MSPLSSSASSSGGEGLSYTEGSKREELFDYTGRILLLARSITPDSSAAAAVAAPTEVVDMPGAMPSSAASSALPPAAEDVLGYVSFRFDTEETLGSRDAEVIYWYVTISRVPVPTVPKARTPSPNAQQLTNLTVMSSNWTLVYGGKDWPKC